MKQVVRRLEMQVKNRPDGFLGNGNITGDKDIKLLRRSTSRIHNSITEFNI
jgi:hypothetical protein